MVGLPPPPSSTRDTTISAVYQDILQTHILTRLDGPALASVACTSSELHTISKEDKLWEKICTSTWPSINDPLVSRVITTFPSGHRSFFSEAYPLIHHHRHISHNVDQTSYPATPTELISAVDVYYGNVPIFSKVEQTETVSGWFRSSPFRVDLVGPKEFVPTWVRQVGGADTWLQQVEQNLSVSWILIDPKETRAMNISSQRAVSVQRHRLTGEVQVKFATVLAGSWEKEYVECEVVVSCGGKEGGEVQVREVSLGMEDMEGKALNGKDSLVILKEAMERGERRKLKDKDGKEAKERYNEFLERKRERKDRIHRKEKVIDWVCIAIGVNFVLGFWSYMMFG